MPTDPVDRSEEEKVALREARDRLVRYATFAVDNFVIDNQHLQHAMTKASWTRLVVEATIGFLLDAEMITEQPIEDGTAFRMQLPAYIRPDAQAAVTYAWRLSEQAEPRRYGTRYGY